MLKCLIVFTHTTPIGVSELFDQWKLHEFNNAQNTLSLSLSYCKISQNSKYNYHSETTIKAEVHHFVFQTGSSHMGIPTYLKRLKYSDDLNHRMSYVNLETQRRLG